MQQVIWLELSSARLGKGGRVKPLFRKREGNNVPRRRQGADNQRASSSKQKSSDGANLFRRNRTLVGSLSATVSSASELNADLQSPRAHIHHLSAHRRRLSTILTAVIFGVAILLWLIYEFTAGVHVSATNNGVVIQSERYQQAITAYLQSHPAERLRFAMNQKQLTAYMKQQVPEVLVVQSNGASGFATGQFDITFRQPIASWLIGSKQYYVDKDGVTFQVNYFEQPAVKIIDKSGVPQIAGTAVASSRFLQFVGRAVDIAKTQGMVIEEATIPPNTTRQLEVKLSGHSYPVKLSLDRPVGEQIEDMGRAVAYFDGKGQSPQYIDVRVSGKAFYK